MEPKKEEKKNDNNTENEIKENKNELKEEKEKETKPIKRPSAWIFLQGENLQGFHLTFILMIVIPISVFFIIRNILSRFNYTKNQQDVFGVVGVLVSVWFILICYAIYYFKDDFYQVFCKKNEKDKEKDKSE